jgi:hypothetical protein
MRSPSVERKAQRISERIAPVALQPGLSAFHFRGKKGIDKSRALW